MQQTMSHFCGFQYFDESNSKQLFDTQSVPKHMNKKKKMTNAKISKMKIERKTKIPT